MPYYTMTDAEEDGGIYSVKATFYADTDDIAIRVLSQHGFWKWTLYDVKGKVIDNKPIICLNHTFGKQYNKWREENVYVKGFKGWEGEEGLDSYWSTWKGTIASVLHSFSTLPIEKRPEYDNTIRGGGYDPERRYRIFIEKQFGDEKSVEFVTHCWLMGDNYGYKGFHGVSS